MMILDKKNEELAAENAELRRQLEEAKGTLEAIRRGDVDALVLSGINGPAVYLLKGADHNYKTMVEEMQEGAVVLSKDCQVVFCNEQAAVMLGLSQENLLGKFFGEFVEDQKLFEQVLQSAKETRHSLTEILLHSDKKSRTFACYLTASRLSMEDIQTTALVMTDLTEQKKQQQKIAENEEFSRSILDQAFDAIVVCDLDGKIIRANRVAYQLAETNPMLRSFNEVFPLYETSADTTEKTSDKRLASAFRFPLQEKVTHHVEQDTELRLSKPSVP